MRKGAADLIPELKLWNEGKGIDLNAFADAVGRYDHAIAYATLFWPDFVVHDDCVFRNQPDPANYLNWMEELKGARHVL